MRLIDADYVVSVLKEVKDETVDKDVLEHIIVTTPTAYDVEIVVDELDQAIYPYSLFDIDGMEIIESLLKADAVETIIRRGGTGR